jgi:tetratricopeptide (TPR) repeat protein
MIAPPTVPRLVSRRVSGFGLGWSAGLAFWAVSITSSGHRDGARARAADAPPERPLGPAVESLIQQKEAQVRSARAEGIELLEKFLKDSADSPETAEALYKLAELTWEEAQADYLGRMGRYQDQLAACRKEAARCLRLPPRPPRLELRRSQNTYLRLIRDYPNFRKLDTVLYLYAFSLQDEGRPAEAIATFERLLAQYPRSRFRADAWMALAEHRFYGQHDYAAAERACRGPRLRAGAQGPALAALWSRALQDRLVRLEARPRRRRGGPFQAGPRPGKRRQPR